MRQQIVAALQSGDLVRAERACYRHLSGQTVGEALYFLGVIRSQQGDVAAARAMFGVAAKMLPTSAELAYNYGIALRNAGDWQAAVPEWQRAVALNPDFIDAWRNIAVAMLESEYWDKTFEALNQVLKHFPDDVHCLMRLGIVHHKRGEMAAAQAVNTKVLSLVPDDPMVWVPLAESLYDQGQLAEAEECYRRALSLAPQSQPLHYNLAHALLAQGRWREGFAEFEWRETKRTCLPREWATLPEWTGREPVGTCVVLWIDQGNGDTFQFLRFVGDVVARGHRVFLTVAASLRRLVSAMPGIAGVLTTGAALPPCERQVALASLPAVLGMNDPTKTWQGPYLQPVGEIPRLKKPGRLAVGLVWAGSPDYLADHDRSMALATLEPLLDVPGVDWFSLQLGPACEQVTQTRWNGIIADAVSTVSDFADTAALIAGLDLVITVDTGVAHLAGALGSPTWVMLRAFGDWRWLNNGDTTAWYPSLRLFRQPARGDWKSVAEAVAEALRKEQK